jgi:hypothetical protein
LFCSRGEEGEESFGLWLIGNYEGEVVFDNPFEEEVPVK